MLDVDTVDGDCPCPPVISRQFTYFQALPQDVTDGGCYLGAAVVAIGSVK
jgi:hypothetical protein